MVMASPVGGVDYPRTWSEFVAWFPDEAACVAFLVRLRWGDGFVCPGLWVDALLVGEPRARVPGVRPMCEADLGHGWHDLCWPAYAADAMVRCGVESVRNEERHVCARDAETPRAW